MSDIATKDFITFNRKACHSEPTSDGYGTRLVYDHEEICEAQLVVDMNKLTNVMLDKLWGQKNQATLARGAIKIRVTKITKKEIPQ